MSIETTHSASGPGSGRGLDAAGTRAAWLLYTLIVLEILFMVSPVAAYYYAVYGLPLNALAAYLALAITSWSG